MRSCSAWPSGVWIDGEQADRTGRQQLRLAALEPHVRVRAGRRARRLADGGLRRRRPGVQPRPADRETTGARRARCPRPRAWRVCQAGRAARMLAALKPRGNPLASGRAGTPRPADGVTVRLRDAGPAAAAGPVRVRLFTGISRGAAVTGLSEDTDGGPPPAADGGGRADGAAVARVGTVTLALTLAPGRPAAPPGGPGRGSARPTPDRPNRPSRCSPGTGCTARARPRPGTCRSPCTCPPPGRAARPGGTRPRVSGSTVACGPTVRLRPAALGLCRTVLAAGHRPGPAAATAAGPLPLRPAAGGGYAAWDAGRARARRRAGAGQLLRRRADPRRASARASRTPRRSRSGEPAGAPARPAAGRAAARCSRPISGPSRRRWTWPCSPPRCEPAAGRAGRAGAAGVGNRAASRSAARPS